MSTPPVYSSLLRYSALVEGPTILFTVTEGETWIITDIEVFAQIGGSINAYAGYAAFGFGSGAQWSVGLPLSPGPQAPYTHNQWTGRIVVPSLNSWYGICHGLNSPACTISGYKLMGISP